MRDDEPQDPGEKTSTPIVTDRDLTEFRQDHAELYGRLLQANERIRRRPGRLGWWLAALWCALCIFIVAEFTPEVLGLPLYKLQSGWVFFFTGFFMLMTYFVLASRQRRAAYRRERPDITADTANAKLTQATLLTAIEGHEPLSVVASEIKADDEFDRRRR